jgi:ParB-like nuclease domain
VATHTMRIDDVVVGDRVRTGPGDLDGLAASIRAVGLLNPIVVTSGHLLISGWRRLDACRALGMSEVPAVAAQYITDVVDRLVAEREEGTCHKEMTVAEKLALGTRIEALPRPADPPGSQVHPDPRERRLARAELAAYAVGMGRTAYYLARAVRRYTQDPQQPEAVRQAARDALAAMNTAAGVRPSYDAFTVKLIRLTTTGPTAAAPPVEAPQAPSRDPAPAPAPPSVVLQGPVSAGPTDSRGRRLPRRSQRKALTEGMAALAGLCEGLAQVGELDESIDPREAERWHRDLTQGLRVLRALNTKLKEHSHVSAER